MNEVTPELIAANCDPAVQRHPRRNRIPKTEAEASHAVPDVAAWPGGIADVPEVGSSLPVTPEAAGGNLIRPDVPEPAIDGLSVCAKDPNAVPVEWRPVCRRTRP